MAKKEARDAMNDSEDRQLLERRWLLFKDANLETLKLLPPWFREYIEVRKANKLADGDQGLDITP